MSADQEVTVSVDLEQDYRFEVDFGQLGVVPLTVDEPPPLGGGQGPNPARLLAAATASCLAASAAFCLRRSRIAVEGMHAEATATLGRNEEGRWRIEGIRVHLRPEVAAEDAHRIGRCLELFEDYCVVTQSVRAGIPIDVEVEPSSRPARRAS